MTRVAIPIVAGLGNALLAVPMVRQLKRKLANSRVTILARLEAMGEVFRRLPEVDQVIVTGSGWRGSLRLALASHRSKPDVYLVPFPSNRWQYSMLALASGARRKILHAYPVGRVRAIHFVGERLPATPGIHDVVQNLNLLRMLNIEPDTDEAPEFLLNDEDRARADELLRGAQVSRPIVIHAGSARTVLARAKRWPAENYARLIEHLSRHTSDPLALIEGPDERGVANEILHHLRQDIRVPVIRLTGPIGDAAGVLAGARLYVGSDSGLAHLASAVGTPAVTLFAPADPTRVCPWNNRHLVVQAEAECSPCMEYPWRKTCPSVKCREPMCIGRITVEQVASVVTRAGGEPSRAHEPARS